MVTEIQNPVEKEIPKKESSRPRTTLNLGSILKPQTKTEEIAKEKKTTSTRQDEPIVESRVRQVWNTYAGDRRNQVAEYHLLSQTFILRNNIIVLLLNNPIEEPLLQGMKSDLVGYLREKLNNSTIQVESEMQQSTTKKKAYTNKEKFESLAEKNPFLFELKERLGLDTDF